MNPAAGRRLMAALIPALALLALPLVGAWSAGLPVAPFIEFPPFTRRVQHPPFAGWAFLGVALLTAGILALFTARGLESCRKPQPIPAAAAEKPFPWWGWTAVLGLAMAWILAWTRRPWMAPFQPHTFTPLWLAYSIAVNALCRRRTGRSLLTHRPGFFLALFPASAAFWWLFEYLNRFVQNWYYEGPDLDAGAYFRHASLAFSTVLPAVISTRDWVASWGWVKRAFGNTRPLAGFDHPGLLWTAAGAAAAGLAGIGKWPHLFFPLVWVAPLIIFSVARRMVGLPQPLQDLATRDWTPVISAMLAALICGFCWELWNYHSLAKWKYAIPYVQRFEIFEMPLLGYAGYLPFGLECALAAGMVDELLSHRKPPAPR
jgi:hypothetical protein